MARFLVVLLLGLIGMKANAQPKNIIFIIADDHRYDALGFMG
jgi:hypothetical protein